MSQHQIVLFRAIDAPVSKANLEFMRKQSSRAEINEWSFCNEYHYGDFHGDEIEMLRRGYDMHLHYANYGIRRLLIRFPAGPPFPHLTRKYIHKKGLKFHPDKKGKGGVLEINPYHEPGDLPDPWEMPGFSSHNESMLDSLLPLRGEMLEGDLRPWYLLHLAMSQDQEHDPEETVEAPLPAGMKSLTESQQALADWYCLDEHLLEAVAADSPDLSQQSNDLAERQSQWLQKQTKEQKEAWLLELLGDSPAAVRAAMISLFQQSGIMPEWPIVERGRTMAELHAVAEQCAAAAKIKADKKAAAARAKLLVNMAADPKKYLGETEQLVKRRSGTAYNEIATILADLRAALADTGRSSLVTAQAEKLKRENPTLKVLAKALQVKGLIGK